MKTVLFTNGSRVSPNDPDGLTKGKVLNGNNFGVGIPRQQSGSVTMIWGGMIRNEVTCLFRVPEELKLPADMYCSTLKKSIEPWISNLLLQQMKDVIILRDLLHGMIPSVKRTVFRTTAMQFRESLCTKFCA